MKKEEARALTDFVLERVKKLDPKPKFVGRRRWDERIKKFESDFLDTLERTDNLYGPIWQFFEDNDRLFIGNDGMMEIAEHVQKEENSWVYRKPGEKPCVIYVG